MRPGSAVLPPEVVELVAATPRRKYDSAVRLAAALGHHMNGLGFCWPSVRRLLDCAGIEHNRTFMNARETLRRECGLRWRSYGRGFVYWWAADAGEAGPTDAQIGEAKARARGRRLSVAAPDGPASATASRPSGAATPRPSGATPDRTPQRNGPVP